MNMESFLFVEYNTVVDWENEKKMQVTKNGH